MKIETYQPTFRPVTIKIESETELWVLYHKFNCGNTQSFDHYCENTQCNGISDYDIGNVAETIFDYMKKSGFVDEN
jgi:hypothetical protein